MKRIIHHIRKQPEEIKRHILYAVMLVFAIILFFLWVYSLGTNLSSPDTQAGVGQDLQPFSTLKDNMVNGYNNL